MSGAGKKWQNIRNNYELYLFVLPMITFFIIFHYIPMYGVTIAFKEYIPNKGISGSPWIGFAQFHRFFSAYYFWEIIRNTFTISLYQLAAGFPIPIILALALNHAGNLRFKKIVQTVTYAPHFISIVVLVGMINVFISPSSGMINHVIKFLGFESIYFAASPKWFKTMYVFSGVWQHMGWGAIVYLASLSGIDPQLYEAAIIDGAGTLKRIWYIDLPGITPTIIIMLILRLGRIMNVGFQKVYLMQNPINLESSEIIATFVYKVGLLDAQFSFSTAVNLFDTMINLVFLIAANAIAKKFTETSLW